MSILSKENIPVSLEQSLSSGDEAVRKEAVSQLIKMPPSEKSFALLGRIMSSDPSPEITFMARKGYDDIRTRLESLRASKDTSSESEGGSNCEHVLRHGDRTSRLNMITLIAKKADPRFLPVLLTTLAEEKTDVFVISALVKVIGALGSASEIGILQQYLRHEDSRVRSNAVEGLELISDEHVFMVLVPMLQDPDNRVKGTTIKALLRFNEAAARKLILKLAAATSEAMRASACYCLGIDNTPWAEHILLKMIERESSVPILKIESQVIIRVGTLISVGWFALQLQKAGDTKTQLYRTCLNSIVERLRIDQAFVTELRDLAAAGTFVSSQDELQALKHSSNGVRKPSDVHVPFDGSNSNQGGSTEVVASSVQENISEMPVVDELSNSFEEDFGVSADLPEPSKETDNWDEPSIERIVSGTNPQLSARKKPELIPHGLGDGSRLKKKPVKEDVSLWKALFNFKEGAGYLLPALILVILFGGVGVAYMVQGRQSNGETKVIRNVGDSISILCRVRFVDKKKNNVTLCRGNEYFHGRFQSDVDLSSIKVNSLVKVNGVVNGEKHLNAMVLECTSIETVK